MAGSGAQVSTELARELEGSFIHCPVFLRLMRAYMAKPVGQDEKECRDFFAHENTDCPFCLAHEVAQRMSQ